VTALLVSPVTAENFPAPHPVHAADPGSVLKVPKAQVVHVATPFDPVDPVLQAHTFEIEPVTAENFPAPYPVQAVEPGSVCRERENRDTRVSVFAGKQIIKKSS